MELRSTATSSLFVLGVLVFVADLGCGAAHITTTVSVYSSPEQQGTNNTFLITTTHRKLIHRGSALADGKRKRRVHQYHDDKCGKAAIEISQAATVPLPSGIPTYTVEIMNRCVSGCNISNIHLSCGWFSSARLINPTIFKRLSYNDCLVNAGKPLRNGAILSFQYANTYPYPLSVSSLHCR